MNVNRTPALTYNSSLLENTERCWTFPFSMTVAFLVVEYALQESLTAVQAVRPLLVLTIVLAACLIMGMLPGQPALRDRRVTCVLLFWLLMAAHIPFAYNNFSAYGLTSAMLPYVVAFMAIVAFTQTAKQLTVVVGLWLALHVYQALHGITHQGRGIGAYWGDENDLGVGLCMAIPPAYFLYMNAGGMKKTFYGACLVIMTSGLIYTFSRGGFLGLVAAVAFCLWRSPRIGSKLRTMVLIGTVAFLVAPSGYWAEMQTIENGTEDSTGEMRVYLWKVAWNMFLDNPLWGVGPGSYVYAVSLYEPPGGFYGRYMGMQPMHSVHFTLLAELAIPGLIIFGILVYSLFRTGLFRQTAGVSTEESNPGDPDERRHERVMFARSAAVGLSGGLVGFFVAGLFVSMLFYPQFWILAALQVATDRVLRGSR